MQRGFCHGLLEGHSQAAFNQIVVRLELEQEIPVDTGMSVQKKCAALARIVTSRSAEAQRRPKRDAV